MNLKVPGAILPIGCAILSTRAKTVRGEPPLGELGLKLIFVYYYTSFRHGRAVHVNSLVEFSIHFDHAD